MNDTWISKYVLWNIFRRFCTSKARNFLILIPIDPNLIFEPSGVGKCNCPSVLKFIYVFICIWFPHYSARAYFYYIVRRIPGRVCDRAHYVILAVQLLTTLVAEQARRRGLGGADMDRRDSLRVRDFLTCNPQSSTGQSPRRIPGLYSTDAAYAEISQGFWDRVCWAGFAQATGCCCSLVRVLGAS